LLSRGGVQADNQNWIAHITVKQLHFEAAAQYRLSQEDLEKSRYGEEIARLKVAEACAKKGLDTGKRGVANSVIEDLKVSYSHKQVLDYRELMGRTYKRL
jgi:hypothetical protein